MNAASTLAYNLRNTTVRKYPFPHFFAEDVFPYDFYDELLTSLPPASDYSTGKSNYNGRLFADPSEAQELEFMKTHAFMVHVLNLFSTWHSSRYASNPAPEFFTDLRFIRDGKGYKIGPHTDAPWKVVSLLFYLPKDYSLQELGTSIYVSKDPTFLCNGGPHYPFEQFERVFTAPFQPNSCTGFYKTANSFHGVEPITIPCTRDVLLYNIYDKQIYDKCHTPKV